MRLGYLLLRKYTTPVHWLYGIYCAFLILSFGLLAGWGMMGIFALWEHWNDKNQRTHEGAMDWWESFFIFCIGQGILAILNYLGMITVRWW